MNNSDVSSIKGTSTVNILAGIWLFLSPWVYRAYMMRDAWNSWVVGALIVLFAAIRVSNPETTKGFSVLNFLLGAWVFLSPWIYNYTADTGRFINSLCVGVIVFVLGIASSSMGHTTTTPPPLRP
jgi:hypothetical protein